MSFKFLTSSVFVIGLARLGMAWLLVWLGLVSFGLALALAHGPGPRSRPPTGLRLRTRMIGMIGVIILVAGEIIPMTRMIAQICKNTGENRENTHEGAAEGRACGFFIHG